MISLESLKNAWKIIKISLKDLYRKYLEISNRRLKKVLENPYYK
jgi:hypothetical protein